MFYVKFAKFQILSVLFILLPSSEQSYLTEHYSASAIEDGKLDTAELIRKYQYPVETHFVTTADNYILRMHRIPRPNAHPVFLMHGLLDTSVTWILFGPWSGLAYYLYDNGYDVWMGNARGNRYSRNHTVLNPDKDKTFWSCSWHEIGYYDLPALIDYVLNQTGYNKLSYYGHSQGTTSFWVMTSMRPQYNQKIASMQALAPVAFMGNLQAPLLPVLQNLARISTDKFFEFFPYSNTFMKLCFPSKPSDDLCLNTLNNILGPDPEQLNMTMLPAIYSHLPAGCSFKQLEHFLQLIDSKRFCLYNYGPLENRKRYNRLLPPDYPLSKISVPVGLYYTYNDYLSSYIDVKFLAKMLPNVVENSLYPYKQWNHVSMLWGIDARKLAHARMLEVMRKYENVSEQTLKNVEIK